MEKKTVSMIWKGLKIFIFLTLIYTGVIMLKLRNVNAGIDIIIVGGLFILFNKVENISNRINLLEDKENGSKMQTVRNKDNKISNMERPGKR